ncbi:Signal transduction histidine-protein kinase BarA [Marinomonas spartinae]|uniref:Sensory/regulatory protein RpfC n=1 Tax=Marinomonas spartinae TaxID=1792290 RepID=A0A1A8T315_9GAMM|nr:ATP-binding protein [Marinomonas spartinae]SBS26503.1 Signal transduction histidine-protein kinase BarA [Marinomonas spartinae]
MLKGIVVVALTALMYWVLGVLGLMVAIPPGYATIIWPASGVALVAAMFFPRVGLYGVFLGSFLVNIFATWYNFNIFVVLLPAVIACGATLQAAVGAWLVDRYVGLPFAFHRVDLVLRFVFLACVLSTLIGATVGCFSLLYFKVMEWDSFWVNWLGWWVGDSIGVLVVVPWFAVLLPRYFGNYFQHPLSLISGLAFILIVTAGLSLGVSEFEENKQSKEFRANAELLEISLNNRIKNSVDLLYGIAGFVRGSESITAKEFDRYAINAMSRDDSFLGVSLNYSVDGVSIPAFEREIQKSYPNLEFRVKERNSSGKLVNATPRKRHIVVTYVVPREKNKAAIGYDVYSQASRREAIDKAIELKQAYPTEPINLVQGDKGVLLFLPFFNEETGAFLGVATAVIGLDVLTKEIVNRGLLPNTELYLVDMKGANGTPILVTRSASAHLPLETVISRFNKGDFGQAVAYDVKVGEKRWRLFQVSENRFYKQPWGVQFVLVCGFLVAGILVWFLLMVSSQMSEIESLVRRRTQDLLEANRSLRASELAHSKAKHEAEEANQAKSLFLANMSHEIRTPLNGVIGCLSLMLNTELRPEQKNLANLSRQSAEALLELINDILDLSKIESGSIVLDEELFELRELVEEVSRLLVFKAQEKGIEFNVPAILIPRVSIFADRLRIKQVIMNLLGNAIKFTSQGEVNLCIHLEPLNEGACELSVKVSDTGIGIKQALKKNLFQRFKQADNSTTRKFGGTGLGLAISKSIVELMGGSIGVDSQEDKGSTFWFNVTVPFESQAEESGNGFQDCAATLVYRNDMGRDYVASLLQEIGVRVTTLNDMAPLLDDDSEVSKQTVKAQCNILLLDDDLYKKVSKVDQTKLKRRCEQGNLTSILLQDYSDENTEPDMKVIHKPVFNRELKQILTQIVILSSKTQTHEFQIEESTEQTNDKTPRFNAMVLVVEDNFTNQVVARGLLARLGIEVEIANNGEEALAKLQQTHYDLIFMDCQMPVMDGYEATGRIRQLETGKTEKNVPIVALSANAMKGDKLVCLDAGMDDHMAKPIDQHELLAVLEKWMPFALEKH